MARIDIGGQMVSRRILITGLSSHCGGRLAQALEADPRIEAIIGVDTVDPRHELERTEFVRVDAEHARVRRIVTAAAIDTVVDTRLDIDPLTAGVGRSRELNVAGTRNILEACNGLGKLVFKSSAEWYGCSSHDPAFFTEEAVRRDAPAGAPEHEVVDAERAVLEFAARNRSTTVTVLRIADPIGAEVRGSQLELLGLPLIPAMFGFDPRFQFIHESDIVAVLEHSVRHDIRGTFNAAADGVLALSEICSLLGKPMLPILPPWGATFAASQLRRLGFRIPVQTVRLLRYGRGLDNRRLKATGYAYRYTTREAVLKLRAQQRLRPLLESGAESYQYEREVEEFLRWSPSVQQARARERSEGNGRREPPVNGYDELRADDLLAVIASMDGSGLAQLREYEASHLARPAVLDALDRRLERPR